MANPDITRMLLMPLATMLKPLQVRQVNAEGKRFKVVVFKRLEPRRGYTLVPSRCLELIGIFRWQSMAQIDLVH